MADMTREKAIECNKNLRMYMELSDKNQPCKFLEENYIALDMAIEALEQEPCEDCVSRQAVLKQLKGCLTGGETEYNYVKLHIDSISSVQPKTECSCEQIKWERDTAIAQLKELGYGLGEKPKTGHWLRVHPLQADDEGAYMCSCCKVGDWRLEGIENFCPNCGARMIEPQNLKYADADTMMPATSVQSKEIYNKGWKDGAEATAYHVELCNEENPTVPLSVIEDIKAEIKMVMDMYEGCEYIGDKARRDELLHVLEIIDKHISGKDKDETTN